MLAFLKKEYPASESSKVEVTGIPKLDYIRDDRSKVNKVDLYFSGSVGQSIFKRELKLNLNDVRCYEVKLA